MQQQSFLRKTVVVALGGDPEKVSPSSMLRLRLGRILWGRSATVGGREVQIADEVFYTIPDRDIPIQIEDTSRQKVQRVYTNLLRAHMVRREGALVSIISLVVGITMLGIVGTIVVHKIDHFMQAAAAQMHQQQQINY